MANAGVPVPFVHYRENIWTFIRTNDSSLLRRKFRSIEESNRVHMIACICSSYRINFIRITKLNKEIFYGKIHLPKE